MTEGVVRGWRAARSVGAGFSEREISHRCKATYSAEDNTLLLEYSVILCTEGVAIKYWTEGYIYIKWDTTAFTFKHLCL